MSGSGCRSLHLRILEALIRTELDSGATPATVRSCEYLTEVDPYGEGPQLLLMRSLAETGGNAAALDSYQDWIRRLEGHGLHPSERAEALAGRLRGGPSTLRPRAILPRGLPARPVLIGRDQDLGTVLEHIAADTRMLSIVGPAGVGKTSLAVAAVWALIDREPTPTTYLELTAVEDRAQLLEALLGAVSGGEAGAATVEDLASLIGTRQLLLVLDNAEHLRDHAEVFAALLDRCPHLQLVLTSRVALRPAAERVYELRPLGGASPHAPTRAIFAAPAVRLLVNRAEELGVPVPTDAGSIRAAGEACRLVDGLPLGIELAAARVASFGYVGLTRELRRAAADGRMPVLGRGASDAAPRHRSLREAIAWSVASAPEPAAELLPGLSVFTGTFDLAAVEAVCRPGDREWVVGAIGDLVDLHLVELARDGLPAVRFRLLETVRSYAAEQLAGSGREEVTRSRHAEHFRERVLALEEDPTADDGGPGEIVPEEAGNVERAIGHFAVRGEDRTVLTMLARLGTYWRSIGRAPAGLRLLDEALGPPAATPRKGGGGGKDVADGAEEAECEIWRAALMAEALGERRRAEVVAALECHLPVVAERSQPARRYRCFSEAVHAAIVVGEPELAERIAERIAAEPATLTERWWRVAIDWELAMAAHLRGRDGEAIAALADVIDRARRIGHRRVELYAWMWAAILGADRSRLPVQPPGFGELLVLAQEADDTRCIVWIQVSDGTVTLLEMRIAEAAEKFHHAMTVARAGNYRHGMGFALMGLIGMAAFSGDDATACRFHGVLGPSLEDLRHVMPRRYFGAYLEVAADLERKAAENRELDAALRAGAGLDWDRAIAEAHGLIRGFLPH